MQDNVRQKIKELAESTFPLPYVSAHKEFIPGETPILYSGPFWNQREIEMAIEALVSGQWITAGEYVARFQNMFGKRFRTNFCHMVNSGSSANLVMIAALKKHLEWQDGDEVIVSPVGFPTTIAPLIQNGLKPVFVDIEMDTLNFDVGKIEEKFTSKTRAIFVSPVLGNPPNMDYLETLCMRQGIALIGDNCDSLGGKWYGKLLNEYYYAWSTSFYPAHHITTGEGGMVCSNDKHLAETVRSLSWWGRDCYCVGAANLLPQGTCGHRFDKWIEGLDATIDHKYVFTNMGYNLKPLELQGAIGLAQLEKIDVIEQRRRDNFNKIAAPFRKTAPINDFARVVSVNPKADPCWFGVPIICTSQERKESLVAYLEKAKIQTRSYFAGNILAHPAYSHLDDKNSYPNANLSLTHVLFIGCAPHFTPTMVNYIVETVEKWAELEAKK